jgi:hypothetical protein
VGENATAFSAILSNNEGDEAFRIPRLPGDAKLMASLGLLSDVIVVALPSKFQSWVEVVSTLLGVARDKEKLSDKKCRLVIVSHAARDPTWVEEIVKTHLQQLVPSLFEAFDIMTPENFQIQWKARTLLGESQMIKELLPYENNAGAVSTLIQQVYQKIGGKQVDQDIAIAESFFELEAITPHEPRLDSRGEPQKRASTPSALFNNLNPQDRVQLVISEAQSKLSYLEIEMQEVILESQSSNQLPMLDFGVKVNRILVDAYDKLNEFPHTTRQGFLSRLVTKAHQLYMDHLQRIRDYYGRRYEACLDRGNDETAWAAEAEHLTEGFRAAAANAVPNLCQPDGALSKVLSFDSTSVLKGLLDDMLEATDLRIDEQSLANEFAGEDESPTRRRFPPWVKRIASRVLALGINYLQGWLAWQGVKRAALERDREMPKFPLF